MRRGQEAKRSLLTRPGFAAPATADCGAIPSRNTAVTPGGAIVPRHAPASAVSKPRLGIDVESGEAHTRLLIDDLRVDFLVFWAVRHVTVVPSNISTRRGMRTGATAGLPSKSPRILGISLKNRLSSLKPLTGNRFSDFETPPEKALIWTANAEEIHLGMLAVCGRQSASQGICANCSTPENSRTFRIYGGPPCARRSGGPPRANAANGEGLSGRRWARRRQSPVGRRHPKSRDNMKLIERWRRTDRYRPEGDFDEMSESSTA
jgi:hypothetical protein